MAGEEPYVAIAAAAIRALALCLALVFVGEKVGVFLASPMIQRLPWQPNYHW